MSLSIGGHKRNTMDTPLLDLSSEVQDTSTESTEATETVETQTEATEAVQTQEQTESTENVDETINTETEAAQQAASESTEISENTETETESTEEVNTQTVEVSDELILKSLSEKLGREITSFDDLPTTSESENDPYLKGLAEWRKKTNRPIEDWVKFNQDFSKVSDADIAREFLQIEFPELTPEEIDLELNTKYISSEDDLDNEAALKNLELKKLASKGRKKLDEMRVQFGEPSEAQLTPEIKQDLDFAQKFKAHQVKVIGDNKAYNEAITAKAGEIKSITMDLGDNISLDFKLPEGSSKSLVDTVQNAPHWKNEDGSWNHEAVVRDAAIISNLPQMLKLAFEQGKNSGVDQTVQETKNVTLGRRSSNESALPNESKGVQIEGLDKYLGKTGMSIRKRN